MNIKRLAEKLTIIFGSTILVGCSIVHVHSQDKVKTYRKFGFVNVVEPASSGAIIDIKFVGLGYVNGDFVIGYENSNSTIMNTNGCAIFINNESQIEPSILAPLKIANCNLIFQNGE